MNLLSYQLEIVKCRPKKKKEKENIDNSGGLFLTKIKILASQSWLKFNFHSLKLSINQHLNISKGLKIMKIKIEATEYG